MTNSTTTSPTHWHEPVVADASRTAGVLVRCISFYQRLRVGRIAPCRFYPSCSQYALEAVATHGAWRGLGLATRRILRCRPLGPHGVDLVPEPKKARTS